ncbi:uroporphyrinogen-III C-methyltransferase [Agrobacterium vitis]|uniref:Uroporphyrinogen-III C-methyltransferase n=1 Tax=Agrobacterium vitis TaxID=373 RepID=A0AAE4WE12_AGRVI|nr:siroheme synthase CysG [Agrobacterium vitis]MCF1496710.1 uroporphyrinogen-III C-methyltransferase [Allorhizobium sp. Av2]MCM2439786.1 uroporphyrinogen-III C-methyltransferase [Agrobacterium vitis]MUZ57317.1 uroporphyrinogen-III C-methyltransferase [Agrobacterium vitis]MVA65626.1 uroporphyrinogen-III C-methyltransferase [Agrobacterium vitis]MVA86651.1 uroporphyrinogen-III C-methyltransferase [Agrobacterium vitis]
MSIESDKLAVFPAFFRVSGAKLAVFGDGDEAFAKARLIANTSATIIAFTQDPEPAYAAFLKRKSIEIDPSPFSPDLLTGMKMVFAATGDGAADRMIVDAARLQKIPANAVDQPDYCDFYTPALVNRAPIAVAIGTEGVGPVLAQMIRAGIDRQLPRSLGKLGRLANSYRHAVDRLVPRGVARRLFWRSFFQGDVADAMESGDVKVARRRATKLLKAAANTVPEGRIFLVGAGPGAEDLLTLRAHRLMMEADAIVYDALVPQAVVDMGRRDADRIPVGKRKGCHSKSQSEINDLLVALGQAGKRVVRLKSGDPLIFGRAGEEMAALRDAGIAYEIVPGVTSALAAAADFELPLTLRGVSSSLVFTTGHDLTGDVLPDWARLALSGATVAVYMGRTVAASVAERLIAGGLAQDTTVAVVENAGRGDRRLLHGTLRELPGLEAMTELTGPVMVIIGDAVAGANFERSMPLAQARLALANVDQQQMTRV